MNGEMEAFETHLDRMEREAQAQAAALAVEKEKTKQLKVQARSDTKQTFVYVVCILAVVAIIAGIGFAIFKGTAGPSAKQQLEDKWRTQCVQAHGTWIPKVGTDGDPLCVIAGGGSMTMKENYNAR